MTSTSSCSQSASRVSSASAATESVPAPQSSVSASPFLLCSVSSPDVRESYSVSAAPKTEGCAVGQPRSRVDGSGNGVLRPRAAVATQAGSETLGEWMDRQSLSRDEVASRLTTELGKTISAKAVALNCNWPIPNSWCEALARSEHAPPEAEPHWERGPRRERAEIKGELSTHAGPSLYAGRPARPSLAYSWLAGLLRSGDLWWGLAASVLGVLLGVAIAVTV
jgi:hypothetical protein